MTKAKELQGMSDDQLEVALRERIEHLFRLRFQSVTERVEAPSEITRTRREIARIKTILHLRKLREEQRQQKQGALDAAAKEAKNVPQTQDKSD